MGIWGVESFANDDALDWLSRLDPAAGPEPVVRELRAVAETSDPYLDSRTAAVALAAAELVAALQGRPHPQLPKAARNWVAAQILSGPLDGAPDFETLALATQALDFVATSSELSALWSQRAEEPSWRAELDGLRMRLSL